MDGVTFINRIKGLRINGSETLKANDFDWIFQQDYDGVLSSFWNYFFDHFDAQSLLAEDEINQYASIEAQGLVLSGEYLERIKSCIVSEIIEESSFPWEDEGFTESEHEDLQLELVKLKEKKKYIMIQRMQLESDLNSKRQKLKSLKQKLELQKREAKITCEAFTTAHLEAKRDASGILSYLGNLKNMPEGALFVSQLPSEDWLVEEEKISGAIDSYVDRHLKETVDLGSSNALLLPSVSENESSNSSSIYDEEYKKRCEELARLTRMSEEASVTDVSVTIEKDQTDAQVQSVLEFARRLAESKRTSSAAVIKEEISSEQRLSLALEQDFGFLKKDVTKDATFLAHRGRFQVLRARSRAAASRRRFILERHEGTKDFLLSQLARLDLMRVLRDADLLKVRKIRDILQRLNVSLSYAYEQTEERLNRLKPLEDPALVKTSNWNHLKDFLPKKVAGNCSQQNKSSDSRELRAKTALNAQQVNLTKLFQICSSLERILFGVSRETGSLPTSWIEPRLANRKRSNQKTISSLQEKMRKLFLDYDKKKKVLQDNPTILEDMLKWVA